VHERILNELTPEQEKRFEELIKIRPWTRSPEERRRHDDRHDPKPGRHTDAPVPTEKKTEPVAQ